jgi:alkylhydroperoxidase family enzyme
MPDRIAPATPAHFEQIADHMARWKKSKGYPPNTWYTMARKPAVFRAYRDLHSAVMMAGGEVPQGLKFLLAAVTSTATGDSYCAAHNAENAHHIAGVPLEKIRALPNFRTALELGAAAGAHPPCVTDAHFAVLKKYFSDDAMVELVAVISLLGWLNRWAQTVAPALEPNALAFAMANLAQSGWQKP